jgi:hypothetical protein
LSRKILEISEKPFSCHPALNLIQGISGSQVLNLIQDIDFMTCLPQAGMLNQACPEEILNQVQNDTFRVQHDIWGHFMTFSELSPSLRSFHHRASKIHWQGGHRWGLGDRFQEETGETFGTDGMGAVEEPCRSGRSLHRDLNG